LVLHRVQADKNLIISRNRAPVAEMGPAQPQRLVRTDHDLVNPALLPDESAIPAAILVKLPAGPRTTMHEKPWARRRDRLRWAAANGLTLNTPNPPDFPGLEAVVTVKPA